MLGKIKQANNQNFYLVALDFDGQTTQSVYVLFIFFTVNCIMSLVNSPRLLNLWKYWIWRTADIFPSLEENSLSHHLIITPEDFTYCRVILEAAQLKLDTH